ncbi:MAG: CHAP domain-containing protein [Oscillospiraceae bacterium]|nr:CHAP domain-containing protein [Oscillospiraceae bacterium]
MKKRIISCILTVLILASVLPANAFADSSVIHRQIHINPLYKDVVDQKQLFSTLNSAPRLYSDTQPQEAGSADEAAVILRKGMENREARIAIRCPADAITPTDGILDEIAEKAMEETGVPTQGDYIRWTYAGWSGSCSLESDDEGLHYVFVYDCKYYTTAAQEAELSEKIDSVLQSLDINDESSDYDVICAVYDYICANVSYDYDNLDDSEYLLKYTAYAAMINKTAVCQGYSALMYRMLQQKNIDCRLIPGSNHAWNIVAIDGVYYNADSTWDAGKDPKNYAYFLCGDSDFAEHTRYSEYSTEEFYRLYPMAETKYVVCPSHSYGAWVTTKAPTCTESGIETRTCAKCGASEDRAIPATGHHYDAVATAPTCTEKGYTTHTCACGDSYTDSSTDAVGHNYKAGICTICGALDPERRPASPQIMITTESGRPKISWNAVNGADKYWVYRSVDGETFDYYARTDKPSFTDGSTSIGTTYHYAVKAVAVLGGRDVSSGRSTAQSIQCRPAAPSVSIYRASGKPQLKWNAVSGAAKYWVYRSTDGVNFKYYDSTAKTSYTNTGALLGTKYHYRVKAVAVVNGKNVASAYSGTKSLFTTPAAPGVSIYRVNGKPQLKWSAVTGAEKYWIYRSTDGVNFKYYDSTTGTSYTNCIAASGTEYYYKVKAAAVVNGKDVASDFSNTKSLFTTPAAPSVSITTSKGKPKLTWKAVKGADNYYIYRSTDGKNFKYYNETDEAGYTNYSTNIGTTYYYKVRAVKTIDGNDHKSDFSAVRSIQCRPAAVNLSISRSYGKPKLTWDAVADADKYWIYRSTDGKNFKYYDTTTKTSYINSGAAFNTIYCYKVKAVKVVNGRNVVSGSGSAKSVITALAKPSVSITTSDGKPYISWDAVDGATGYYVFRSTDGKNYSVLGYTTRTNYTNTASNAGTTYYYKVKADNSNTKTAICANSDKTAEKLVEQAKSWLGCKESDGSNEEIIDTYNGHEPVARGLKLGYKDPWCAAFVSACAIKTGMTDIIPTECGCGTMVKLFKKLGAWDENDGRIPNVGDIIFFDWDDSGYGDNDGFPGHVGIVEKVSGTKITVIDGNNKNDAVERRTVQINGRFIRGYGVPKYSGFRSGDTRSDYSNAVSVRCGLTAPTPSITTSEGKPKLTWSAVPGAAKYWVYRSTDGKSFSYLNSTVGTSYTDSGAKKNTKYYYKVKAVYSSNSDMNSALSAAVSIKATK